MPAETPVYRWPVPLLSEVVSAPALQDHFEGIDDTISEMKAALDLYYDMPTVSVYSGPTLGGTGFDSVSWEVALWDTDQMFATGSPLFVTARRAGIARASFFLGEMTNVSAPIWVESRVLRTRDAVGEVVLRRKIHIEAPGNFSIWNRPFISGLIHLLPGDTLAFQIRGNGAFDAADAAAQLTYRVLQGPHLNANPHFEVTLDPWTSAGTSALVRSADLPRLGRWSAQLTPTGTDATVLLQSEAIPVVVGAQYAATGYVSPSLLYANNSIAIEWRDAGDVVLSSSVGPTLSAAANGWRFLWARGTAPANAATCRIQCRSTGTPPATTQFRWDEIYLVRTA